MTNHTADTTHTAPGTAPDAAVAALVAAVEMIIKTFTGGVPFGAAGNVLERIKAVREQMDQLTFAMLAPLAQMETSGELLAEGGQKSLKAYLTHAWGIPHGEAERLMFLAQNLHNETLPETAAALEEGTMTIGEAAAIASGAEREVDKRDAKANPDADHYRSKIDTGLAGLKFQKPATSVKTLTSTAHALGLELNPARPEKNEEREFAARGARLRTTFGGSFTFEAWGPASDGERLKAALASFTAPYGTAEKAPANGVGTNGTNGAVGADGATGAGSAASGGTDIGLIPAGEAVTSRYARTYDALISAAGFAHSHHGHHGHTNGTAGAAANASGVGTGSGTAGAATGGPASGADAGAGPVGDAAGYGDGPEGFASGAGGSAGAADSSADAGAGGTATGGGGAADATDSGVGASAGGTASGGGCSQPPGTKAVINITVPLSALLGFGFAFNNNNDDNVNGGTGTDTNGVGAAGATNTTGATGALGVLGAPTGPGPEPGSVPDPGGGGGATATADGTATVDGTNTNTGPPSTTDAPGSAGSSGSADVPGSPGYAGAPGNPGSPVSSGVAVTEDGNVLALSAVRAMAPTAQIRRLIFDDRTGLPLDLGRAHRLAPGYLRTAAFIGHTTCAWSGGCDVPVSQCEADHITEFTHGGTTTAANLQPLCSTHNRLKYRRSGRDGRDGRTHGARGAGGDANGGSGAEGTDPGNPGDTDNVGIG